MADRPRERKFGLDYEMAKRILSRYPSDLAPEVLADWFREAREAGGDDPEAHERRSAWLRRRRMFPLDTPVT